MNWGGKIVNKVIEGEIRFDPPLSLFFDGKATSVLLSKFGKPKELGVWSFPVYKTEMVEDLIFNKRRGVLKLGSGFDMYRSFGGRSVKFLKDLTRKQRENFAKITISNIEQNNSWYVWQPEVKEKVIVKKPRQNKRCKGRIRNMIFTSLYGKSNVIGFGANIYNKSKIVRGGHPIASVCLSD